MVSLRAERASFICVRKNVRRQKSAKNNPPLTNQVNNFRSTVTNMERDMWKRTQEAMGGSGIQRKWSRQQMSS